MTSTREDLWSLIRSERTALADDLADLTDAQWRAATLCGDWDVEDVVAHLTAGASTGRWAWLRSIAAARFDAGRHNARQLAVHRGRTPAETLERYRAVVTSTVAPTRDTAAWLGEVVVHGQDVRRPLGIERMPSAESVELVARFFVSKDFTVNSRRAARGLELVATDGPFRHGAGASVRGTTIALVMALAGREVYCDDLDGPGVDTLRERAATA